MHRRLRTADELFGEDFEGEAEKKQAATKGKEGDDDEKALEEILAGGESFFAGDDLAAILSGSIKSREKPQQKSPAPASAAAAPPVLRSVLWGDDSSLESGAATTAASTVAETRKTYDEIARALEADFAELDMRKETSARPTISTTTASPPTRAKRPVPSKPLPSRPENQPSPPAVAAGAKAVLAVPVPVFMTPLARSPVIPQSPSPATEKGKPPQPKATRVGFKPTEAAVPVDHDVEVAEIEFVDFSPQPTLSSSGRQQAMTKEERARKKKEREDALKKYQTTLEATLAKFHKEQTIVREQARKLYAQLTADISKYRTWAKPQLLNLYRRFAMARAGIIDSQQELLNEQTSPIGKKLSDVRYLLKLNREDKQFGIRNEFFCDPTVLAKNRSAAEKRRAIEVLTEARDALTERVKNAILQASCGNTPDARKTKLCAILNQIRMEPGRPFFFPFNQDVQDSFDEWFRDQRTDEGRRVAHFCKVITDSVQGEGEKVKPEEIVLFIDEFAGKLATSFSVSDPSGIEKLRLLIERSLFPLVYNEVIALSPDHPIRDFDVPILDKIFAFRRRPHPAFSIDRAFTQGESDPFSEAIKVLSFLPFHIVPVDMIHCVERTIACICHIGKVFLQRPLGADEIFPLLNHVVIHTDLPCINETLFMMTTLSQAQDRSAEFGWSVATFEASYQLIKQTKPLSLTQTLFTPIKQMKQGPL